MKPVKNSWPYPYYVGQKYKLRRDDFSFWPNPELEITAITPDGGTITYNYLQRPHAKETYSCSSEHFLADLISIN